MTKYVICLGKDRYYKPISSTFTATKIEYAEQYDKKTAYWILTKLIDAGYEHAFVMKMP